MRSRLTVACLCVAGTLVFLLTGIGGLRSAGLGLHRLFCLAGLYLILRTPRRLAGLFAAERGQQTLGLLFLSGLTSAEVFASKAVSSVLIAFNDLLAILPILALPFLMGGVSFDLFVATVVGLPTVLLFVLSVSLLASVLSEDEGAATLLTWSLIVVFCCSGPLGSLAQAQLAPAVSPSSWWLRTSPLYGPFLLLRKFNAASVAEFWLNFALVIGWSILCLFGADLALKALWREREAERDWLIPWRERWASAGSWHHRETAPDCGDLARCQSVCVVCGEEPPGVQARLGAGRGCERTLVDRLGIVGAGLAQPGCWICGGSDPQLRLAVAPAICSRA